LNYGLPSKHMDAERALAGPKREKTLCRVHAFRVARALSIAKTDGSVLNIRASHEPASAAPFDIRAFGRFVSIHSRDLLLLQGQPLDEPVVQHGPFVMNTPDKIRDAYADYRSTRSGTWPWPTPDPNHGPSRGRFAILEATTPRPQPPVHKHSNRSENGELSMSIKENVQVVKDFFAATGSGDRRRLLSLCAEDIEWIVPGEGWALAGTHRGHAGLEDLLQKASGLETSFPEPPEFVAQGDRVLMTGLARGKVKATNRPFEDYFVFAMTVRNGKVTNIREYVDTQALARASEPRVSDERARRNARADTRRR
jgi:ketosteroid isomerase-like protein